MVLSTVGIKSFWKNLFKNVDKIETRLIRGLENLKVEMLTTLNGCSYQNNHFYDQKRTIEELENKEKINNRKSLTQNEFVFEQGWMAALVRDRKKNFPCISNKMNIKEKFRREKVLLRSDGSKFSS